MSARGHPRHEPAAAGDCALATADAQRLAGNALVCLGQIFRARGARRLVGLTLQGLAGARDAEGDIAGARGLYAEALQNFENAGAERSVATVAGNLAETEFRAGDPVAALRYASESLVIDRARNDTFRIANVRCNMAAYLISLERWEEAREHARDAAISARTARYDVQLAFALQHLAAVEVLQPRAEAARSDPRLAAAQTARLGRRAFDSLEAEREYTEAQEYAAALAALRKMFGATRVAELLAEGRSWDEAEALDAVGCTCACS